MIGKQHGAGVSVGPAFHYREKEKKGETNQIIDQHCKREDTKRAHRGTKRQHIENYQGQRRKQEIVGNRVSVNREDVGQIVILKGVVALKALHRRGETERQAGAPLMLVPQPCLDKRLDVVGCENKSQQTQQFWFTVNHLSSPARSA